MNFKLIKRAVCPMCGSNDPAFYARPCDNDGHMPNFAHEWHTLSQNTLNQGVSLHKDANDALNSLSKEWAANDSLWLTQTDTEESLRKFAQEICEIAAMMVLEQRCERYTEWDKACTVLAMHIRNGGKREG